MKYFKIIIDFFEKNIFSDAVFIAISRRNPIEEFVKNGRDRSAPIDRLRLKWRYLILFDSLKYITYSNIYEKELI